MPPMAQQKNVGPTRPLSERLETSNFVYPEGGSMIGAIFSLLLSLNVLLLLWKIKRPDRKEKMKKRKERKKEKM